MLPYYFAPQLAVSPQKLNRDLFILDGRTANEYPISQFGGIADDDSNNPVNNQEAILEAIKVASNHGGGTIIADKKYAAWSTSGTVLVINSPNITFRGTGWNTGIRVPRLATPVYPKGLFGLTTNSSNFGIYNMGLWGPQTYADSIGVPVNKIVRGVWVCEPDGNTEEDSQFYANWLFDKVLWGIHNSVEGWAVAYQGESQQRVTLQNSQVNSQISDITDFGYAFNCGGIDTTIDNNEVYPLNGNLARHAFYFSDHAVSLKITRNRITNMSSEAITSNQGVINGTYDITVDDNTITNCLAVGAPTISAAIDMSGVHDFSVTSNKIITTDTTNWGRTSGIQCYFDQAAANTNINGKITGNIIVGQQRHGVDVQNSINIEVVGNILEDVGLDGVADALHVELSNNVRFINNTVTINSGNTLHSVVNIDTTAPVPTYVHAWGNKVIKNGTGTYSNESLNFDVSPHSYFRSGNTPQTSRPAFDQTNTPNIISEVPFITCNASTYQEITDFLNPEDGQVFTVRASLLPVRIKNVSRIICASNNDIDLIANRTATFRYDANTNAFMELSRRADLEFALEPTNGRWSLGSREWNINPLGNGYAGWINILAGTALTAADVWPLVSTSGHANAGDTRCWHNGNAYLAASTGTCGGTPPTWTSGTHSDGGVNWTYVEPKAIFSLFGRLDRTEGVPSGSEINMRITDAFANVDTTVTPLINLDTAFNHLEPVWFYKTNAGGADMTFAPGTGGDTVEGGAAYAAVGKIRMGFVGSTTTKNWTFVSAI